MRSILFTCLLSLFGLPIFAQEGGSIALVEKGVAAYDSGYYDKAIPLFDQAIATDPDYYMGYYEKSLTLFRLERMKECIDLCKLVLKRFPDRKENVGIYINYGSALDGLGKSEEAIKVYNRGIKKYPDHSLLHFNKAVTLFMGKEYEDAADELKTAIFLNPVHASSHLFLAYSVAGTNKMGAVLALTDYLLLEPEGQRAAKSLKFLMQLLVGNVQKGEGNNTNITLNIGALKDNRPDNFSSLEMMIPLSVAVDNSKENNDRNVAQKLSHTLSLFPSSEDGDRVNRKTFFHDYYLPFLQDMQKDSTVFETACYIIYASSDDKVVREWLAVNKDRVDAFYKWFDKYRWRKEG